MLRWFYDTWGFLALADRSDQDHETAVTADRWRKDHAVTMVTTDYVFDETITALHSLAGAKAALEFSDLMQARIAGNRLSFVEVGSSRRERALRYFRRLSPDVPRLSFTDCTSFAVMEELGIELAFTADGHFRRAGARIRPLFEVERGRLTWSPPDS